MRGLNRDLAAKVETSLRRSHSVIKLVNALAPHDNNRRSGDTSVHGHDFHDENLLILLS